MLLFFYIDESMWLKASSISESLSCVLSLAVVKGKILVLPTYRDHSPLCVGQLRGGHDIV